MISQREYLTQAQSLLKAKPEQVAERIQSLKQEVKKLRKAADRQEAVSFDWASLLNQCQKVGEVSLLTAEIPNANMKTLRTLMDDLRSRLAQKSVVCLAGQEAGKVSLLLYVSKDLHERLQAPALVGDIAAEVGGSGGGRADLAQAGGNNPAGIANALAKVANLLG